MGFSPATATFRFDPGQTPIPRPTLPLGAILDWTMGTPAGFAAYRDPKVNAALKKVLTAWCDYLNSPASLYVLNDSPSGWTSDAAREAIGIDGFVNLRWPHAAQQSWPHP